MANSGPSVDSTTLLAHTDWMHGLARQLVSDENLADDIAQEAASIALESGRSARTAKPWLQTVVRNLARRSFRDRSRRMRREKTAARPEGIPVDDTVERAELHNQLTSWVLELDEPYRSALLLRFFDDSSPKEIAERLDVPSSTVRVWLSRGLARIRTRLDERHGDHRAWSVLLVDVFGLDRSVVTSVAASVASAGAVSWWSLGGWIMATKNWSIAVPLILLLIGGGVILKVAIGEDASKQNPPPTVASHSDPKSGATPSVSNETIEPVTDSATDSSSNKSLARVEGRVVDTSKEPVSGVSLRVVEVGSGKEITRLESGSNGEFDFETRPGVIDILTSDARWTTSSLRRLQIKGDVDDLTIEVSEPGTICGMVLDKVTQNPIPGARVRALYFDQVLRETLSDEEGRFCLDGVMTAPADVKISALANGYVRSNTNYEPSVRLEPGETQEEYRLNLEPGVLVSGRVVDEERRGLAGATVRYFPFRAAGTSWSTRGAHTADPSREDDGHFRFWLPSGQTYALWAETENRVTDSRFDVELGVEGLRIGDWVARPGGVVEGRIVDELGEPLSECRVSCSPLRVNANRTTTSDADGRFVLSNLVPGKHRVSTMVEGTPLSAESDRPLVVDHERRTTGVEFRVNVGWKTSIAGRVSWADGRPAGQQSVQVQRGQEVTFTQTDRDGRFTALGLTAGDYNVIMGENSRVVAAGTDDLEWEIQSPREQTIEISVIDGLTGEPIPYFSHRVTNGTTINTTAARNHPNGTFSLRRASNERLVVWVGAVEKGEGELVVESTGSTEPLNLELVVRSGTVVRGRVIDADGAPVADVALRQVAHEGAETLARSGSDGSFQFGRNDVAVLYARHPEFSLTQIDILSDDDLVIVLEPLALVTGRVVQGDAPFVGKIVARF